MKFDFLLNLVIFSPVQTANVKSLNPVNQVFTGFIF